MPSLQWSKLSGLQLGRYAEYYVKMEFTSYGFSVFSSEVDDHGIDFVVCPTDGNKYYEIQVKAVRNYHYTFVEKEKMSSPSGGPLPENRFVCYVRFEDNKLPEVYLIPAQAWLQPNAVFKSKDYAGKKTKPEWGISISKKTYGLLQAYRFEKVITELESPAAILDKG